MVVGLLSWKRGILPLLIQTAFSLILPFRFPYLFMHCRRMKPFCTCSSTPPKINEPQIYPLNFGASQKYSGIKARLDHLALSQCFYSFSPHSIHHINHAPCGKRSPTALQNRQRASAQKQKRPKDTNRYKLTWNRIILSSKGDALILP